MCVLVIEDDVTVGKVLQKNLDKLGCKAQLAVTAADAIRDFQKYPYKLILMDIGLPDMDGLEATKEIRQLANPGPTVPIVAITAGHSSPAECLAVGMNDYYQKPVLSNQLKEIVEKWTGCLR